MHKFLKIAQQIIEDSYNCSQCPDQVVGKIKKEINGDFCSDWNKDGFKTRININYKNITVGKKIILILESPHIEEYIKPLGPAKSTTGNNIRELFEEVCGANISIGSFDLVLMNAIQYQCSLGFPTKHFRDKVFIKTWECFGKTEFKYRLNKLVSVDDIVVNCCTAGNGKIKLRTLVKDAISEMQLRSEIILEFEHPSNWKREKNKAIKNNRTPDFKWKNA